MIWIHGGPESQLRPIWYALHQYFVARGFAVAAPNVRGSTGYGKRYEHLDDVEKRLDSVRDLAALHDWLETRRGIDASRAVLFGGSYGGYMVLAGLAFHAERWAAGVDIVGISSLVTFLENTVGLPARLPRARVRLARARPRAARVDLADLAHRRDPGAALHHPRRERPARSALRGRAAPPRAHRPRRPVRAARLRGRGARAREAEEPARRLSSRRRVPRGVLLRPFDRNELTTPRP